MFYIPHTYTLCIYIFWYVFFDETYKLKLIIFLHLVLKRTAFTVVAVATLDTHNSTLLGMNGKKEMLHAEVSSSCMRKRVARDVHVYVFW